MAKPSRSPRSRPRRAARAPRVEAPPSVAAEAPKPTTATSARTSRGIAPRKRGAEVACLTAYVPPELARCLRVRAAQEGRTGSELVAEALVRYLAEALSR